jgi:hypothetical protein
MIDTPDLAADVERLEREVARLKDEAERLRLRIANDAIRMAELAAPQGGPWWKCCGNPVVGEEDV